MRADQTSPVDTRAARRAPGLLAIPRIDRAAAGRAALRASFEPLIALAATATA